MWNISFKNISISIKILLYTYLLGIILLITLPLNTAKELNNTTILQLRGDYFFHILLFLPWMFLHNAAFGNLRSGRSFWPLAFSFWSDGKTKGKRQKEKDKRKKYLSQKPTANSQKPIANSQQPTASPPKSCSTSIPSAGMINLFPG